MQIDSSRLFIVNRGSGRGCKHADMMRFSLIKEAHHVKTRPRLVVNLAHSKNKANWLIIPEWRWRSPRSESKNVEGRRCLRGARIRRRSQGIEDRCQHGLVL